MKNDFWKQNPDFKSVFSFMSFVYGYPSFFGFCFQSVVGCLWVNLEAIKRFMIYLNLNSDLFNCLKMIWICFENNKWGIKGAIWFKYHDIHKKSWQFILENPILNPQDKKKSKRNREWTIFIKIHFATLMLVTGYIDVSDRLMSVTTLRLWWPSRKLWNKYLPI